MKKQSFAMKGRGRSEDLYALGIIETISRANPTGRKAREWFYESICSGDNRGIKEFFTRTDPESAQKLIEHLKLVESAIYSDVKIIYDQYFDETEFSE